MKHYALVSESGPLPIALETENHNDESSKSNSAVDQEESRFNAVRKELANIFSSYAEHFPNPKLEEEARVRDTLLQAASVAKTAASQSHPRREISSQEKTKKAHQNKGFFSTLFGLAQKDEPTLFNSDTEVAVGSEEEKQQRRLRYFDYPEQENAVEYDGLCGTVNSLDTSCIPEEAYSVARFHLTSSKMRDRLPNMVRSASQKIVVVGLGAFVEIQDGTSKVSYTSDRGDLLEFSSRYDFKTANVRAAMIGENSVAVSWGFIDGLIVVYRRAAFPAFNGWEQACILGASGTILEAMTGMLYEEGDFVGSPLLQIADIVPMIVETSKPSYEGDDGQPLIASLAVARLGGFLEFVPLPSSLWNGPVLSPDNYQRQRLPTRKRMQHYSVGKKIATPENTVALSTGDYHKDVVCLQAFRTNVTGETEWDIGTYPDAPPGEFLLAAAGASHDCSECVTFWAVSTLFGDRPTGDLFRLHVTLIEALELGSGPDVTVFATPQIMQRWRHHRRIELDRHETTTIRVNNIVPAAESTSKRVATISTAAPIVRMEFGQLNNAHQLHLAILDWNGGVTILDCSLIGTVVSQIPSAKKHTSPGPKNDQDQAPLAVTLAPRSFLTKKISQSKSHSKNQSLPMVENIFWLMPDDAQSSFSSAPPPLAVLTRDPCLLHIVNFKADGRKQIMLNQTRVASVNFPPTSAAMGKLGNDMISFVSFKRTNASRGILSCYALKNLSASEVFDSLAKACKYEDVIQTAAKFPQPDQLRFKDIVRHCHKKLWETKRDHDSLLKSGDADFIIEEALCFCEGGVTASGSSFGMLRSVANCAVAVANSDPLLASPKLRSVLEFLNQLGTYELLCIHFRVEMSLERFQEQIRKTRLKELALQLAQSGEISALSVLCFRHRRELSIDIFEVLDAIPLSTAISKYLHMLPVIQNGVFSDSFLKGLDAASTSKAHFSLLPKHFQELEGVIMVKDTKDEQVTLSVNSDLSDYVNPMLVSNAAAWFTNRAAQIQQFLGDYDEATNLLKAGVICTIDSYDREQEVISCTKSVQKLYLTWKGMIAMHEMTNDRIFVDFGCLSPVLCIDKLGSMSVEDIIVLVLDGENNQSRIFEKCLIYLKPLLELAALESPSSNKFDMDQALASYCVRHIQSCFQLENTSKGENESKMMKSIKRALGHCAAVTIGSRSSMAIHDRLIKDKNVLIRMVLDFVENLAELCSYFTLSSINLKEILDLLWKIYEALPAHLPASMESTKEMRILFERLDGLFKDLVMVDILSRWPGCAPFDMFMRRQRSRCLSKNLEMPAKDDGHATLQRMCKSFIMLMQQNDENLGNASTRNMVLDLLTDIEQICSVCFNQTIVRPIISSLLIPDLLQTGHINEVAELLDHARPDFIDREMAISAAHTFVTDSLFSDSSLGGDKVKLAIRCQDTIGPFFPELENSFRSDRRFLDAANFIQTVFYDGFDQASPRPADIKKQKPLDMIESIMQEIPVSIVCGCTEWRNDQLALELNEQLRFSNTLLGDDGPRNGLPQLPGGALFHLATMLGLEDGISAMLVKCRVIHHAAENGWYGAAAAVCRTLISSSSDLFCDPASASSISATVVEIACQESYNDIFTRFELVQTVLDAIRADLFVEDCQAFDTLVGIYPTLELRCSKFHGRYLQQNEGSAARLIARVYHYIQNEYNSDLHLLYSDLLLQASNGEVHDSLVNALSRFVSYFCITESIRPKTEINQAEKADLADALALSWSLIQHIPDHENATSCVDELQNILNDQVAGVATKERFNSEWFGQAKVNTEIVRQLVGRGYSENEARRAAVMTQNTSVDEALSWAIARSTNTHLLDSPFAVLRQPDKKFVDDVSIHVLQRLLDAASEVKQNPQAIYEFFRGLRCCRAEDASNFRNVPDYSGTASGSGSEAIHVAMTTTAPIHTTNESYDYVDKDCLPSVADNLKSAGGHQKSNIPRNLMFASDSPGVSTQQNTSPIRFKGDAELDVMSSPAENHAKAQTSPFLKTLDRYTLRKRGQEAKEALSKLKQKGNSRDRTRLIEEGRELLRRTKGGFSALTQGRSGVLQSDRGPELKNSSL